MLLSGADSGVPEGDCVLELLLLTVPWSSVSRSPLLMTCRQQHGHHHTVSLKGVVCGMNASYPWQHPNLLRCVSFKPTVDTNKPDTWCTAQPRCFGPQAVTAAADPERRGPCRGCETSTHTDETHIVSYSNPCELGCQRAGEFWRERVCKQFGRCRAAISRPSSTNASDEQYLSVQRPCAWRSLSVPPATHALLLG
jgi:hypothetical protein